MARPTDLLIRLRGVNETDTATNEAIANMEAVENAARRTSRASKKDWGGVTDLFSSVLPRGLQRTVRQFKSTNRSVGRLSKSFKALKAAWASIGIGLIIIALEQIVENWDKITEALGFYNAEAERTKEINIEQNKAIAQLNAETKGYISLLKESTTTTEQQAEAVEFLNKKFGDYIDTEATVEEQVKQVNEIMAQREAVIKAQIEAASRQADFEEKNYVKTNARVKDEKKFFETLADAKIRLDKEEQDAKDRLNEATLILTTTTSEYNKIIGVGTEREDERAAAVRKRLEDEKMAAKIRADLARQAQADADYLADLEKRISEEIMLAKIEDEQKRAEAELEIRHIETLDKATLAGATSEQLLLIEDKYLMDLAELKESYREDDPNVKTPEQIAEEQADVLAEMDLAALNELEQERFRIQERYDQRLELANGNHTLMKQAQELFDADMEALAEESEKKIQSIKEAGIKATVSAARGLFSTMGRMAEDGSEQAKALAITDVLLAQAVSLANGIKVATKSAATPYDMAAGIITAITAVMGAFVGVDAILNEAGTSSGGGGGGVPSTTPLVPEQVSRTETTGKAFVVQSDLEGAALQANQLYSQTALGGG